MGNFLLVSASEIAALVKAPDGIHAFLEQRLAAPPPNEYVDADKAWHILHFLLTGTAWAGEAPLNFIVCGGEEIGDEEVGYGPARALLPPDVAALDAALEALPAAALAARYDPAQMAALKIYGASRNPQDVSSGVGVQWATATYEEVRALVREGAKTGRGLLVWVS